MRTYILMMVAVLASLVAGCGAYIPGSYGSPTVVNGREVSRVEGHYSYHNSQVRVETNRQIYPTCLAEMGEMPGGQEIYECQYEAVDRLRTRQMQRRMMVYPYYGGYGAYGGYSLPYYRTPQRWYRPGFNDRW